MKRFLVVAMVAVLILGCGVKTHQIKLGEGRAFLGEVGVKKSLTYIGSSMKDTLIIQSDENGNAIISAGKGTLEIIPFYLSTTARAEYTGQMKKLIEWGQICAKEKIEIKKFVGSISTQSGFMAGPVIVSNSFTSGPEGKQWLGIMNFCQIQSALTVNRNIGSSPCVKEVSLYLQPDSVAQLIKYLDMVPEYSSKASVSKSKSDLLK